jgi:hypothetical protein
MKKRPDPIVIDRPPTRRDPDGRYRVLRAGKTETYEVIRGLVLRVVE